METLVFKPLGRRTASLELWEGADLVAEVFEAADGKRRLFPSALGQEQGLDWEELARLTPRIAALLDEADEQMRQGHSSLGEA